MHNLFFIEQLSPLYEDVQRSGIFPDSKFFPDCTLLATPEKILLAYQKAKEGPDFDLKRFVETHFDLPVEADSGYESAQKPISQHLDDLWTVLSRTPETNEDEAISTLIALPHPYIVPGGRFREVYYWDSYFTILGLRKAGRTDLIEHITDNFAHLIDTYGFVPNGNRTYYLSRSQPPFFALIVNLLSEIKGAGILVRYRRQLEKEYAFWMHGENTLSAENTSHRRVVRLSEEVILNRHWDDRNTPRPEAYMEDIHLAQSSDQALEHTYRHIRAAAESGWDFSSRWFADGQNMSSIHTTDYLPVDLNCLLYYLEKTLVNVYRQLPDRVPADVMKEKARERKNAIQYYCWSAKDGFYFDYDVSKSSVSNSWHAAAMFPLFFHIATAEQAAAVAANLEAKLLAPGGLKTTLAITGQQWDAPNGWAPLQWIAYQGLMNYGYESLAQTLRDRWIKLNEQTYTETGKMMEKYNVMDISLKAGGGEYPNQDGFGWTNGVFLGLGG